MSFHPLRGSAGTAGAKIGLGDWTEEQLTGACYQWEGLIVRVVELLLAVPNATTWLEDVSIDEEKREIRVKYGAETSLAAGFHMPEDTLVISFDDFLDPNMEKAKARIKKDWNDNRKAKEKAWKADRDEQRKQDELDILHSLQKKYPDE